MTSLVTAAKRTRVLAFFAALAWFFGVTPAAGSRILLAVLAAAAIAADVYLDEHAGHRTRHPHYDKAA